MLGYVDRVSYPSDFSTLFSTEASSGILSPLLNAELQERNRQVGKRPEERNQNNERSRKYDIGE